MGRADIFTTQRDHKRGTAKTSKKSDLVKSPDQRAKFSGSTSATLAARLSGRGDETPPQNVFHLQSQRKGHGARQPSRTQGQHLPFSDVALPDPRSHGQVRAGKSRKGTCILLYSLPLQFLLAVKVIGLKIKHIKSNPCKGFSKTMTKSRKATSVQQSIQRHNHKLRPMLLILKREAIKFWCHHKVLRIHPHPSLCALPLPRNADCSPPHTPPP